MENLNTPSNVNDGRQPSDTARRTLEGTATVSVPAPSPLAELTTLPPPSTPQPSDLAARPSSGAPAAAPEAFPIIPGYEILRRLGQGGMGQVYKARHADSDRLVAVKIIRADRQEDVQIIRRFQREAKAGRRVDHPNIVAFLDAQQIENLCYLTMEYVEGNDLAQLLVQADGPLAVPLACECARQAALGLQHAHERGLIHRDVKPSNLLLCKEVMVVKILDMGLVRLGACPESGHAESELTISGVMMGTPAYMAPEQVFDAKNVDGRADIYSLGCTLYEMLAGRPPHRHQMKEPPPLNYVRPEVSPVLAAVVQTMMARMPEDRYAAAVDVAMALTPFCHKRADSMGRHEEAVEPKASAEPNVPGAPRANHWLLWLSVGAAILVVLLLGLGLAWIVGHTPPSPP
jgi:serine/threonine protein kinase